MENVFLQNHNNIVQNVRKGHSLLVISLLLKLLVISSVDWLFQLCLAFSTIDRTGDFGFCISEYSLFQFSDLMSVLIVFDERKTTRNIYFVSIHNSLYTQCIGAPIKKHIFFANLFSTFFKKPQIVFLQKAKKALYMNKQQQNSSSWAAKSTTQLLKFISSLKQKTKTKT